MITTIIFDFGGIISENADSWETMYKRIPEKTGLTLGKLEEIFEENWIDISIGKKDFIKDFLNKVVQKSKNEITIDELLDIYSSDTKINQDVMNIIQNLRNRGFRVIILSNESKTGEKFRLEKIRSFVDEIYSSATVGMRKPDPQIYKYVLKKENLKIDEALLIDDKERNIVAAKELGIEGIVYKNLEQLKEALKKFLF